jgi:hypothetical protein
MSLGISIVDACTGIDTVKAQNVVANARIFGRHWNNCPSDAHTPVESMAAAREQTGGRPV